MDKIEKPNTSKKTKRANQKKTKSKQSWNRALINDPGSSVSACSMAQVIVTTAKRGLHMTPKFETESRFEENQIEVK